MTLERALANSVKSKNISVKIPDSAASSDGRPKHLAIGEMGEAIAAKYLADNGYMLLGNNVRLRCGEIDIIAKKDDEIVFVEVRTRSIGRVLPADRSVGPDKLRKLVRAARAWTEARNYDGFWRIDLIAITITEENKIEIEHLCDITEGIS